MSILFPWGKSTLLIYSMRPGLKVTDALIEALEIVEKTGSGVSFRFNGGFGDVDITIEPQKATK